MWRLRHLLNIHNKVIRRALDTYSVLVVVACWLNGLGVGVGLVLGPGIALGVR